MGQKPGDARARGAGELLLVAATIAGVVAGAYTNVQRAR